MVDVRKVLEDAVIDDLVHAGENDPQFLRETFSQGLKGVWHYTDRQLVNEVLGSEIAGGESFTTQIDKAMVIMQHQVDNPEYRVAIIEFTPKVDEAILDQRDKSLGKAYPVFLRHDLDDRDVYGMAWEGAHKKLGIINFDHFDKTVYTVAGKANPRIATDYNNEAVSFGDPIGQKAIE